MDQDADSVWVMTLNCLGYNKCAFAMMCIHNDSYLQICIIVNTHLRALTAKFSMKIEKCINNLGRKKR